MSSQVHSDSVVPWEPGYWEVADAVSPPAQKLESSVTDPARCTLWMKLDVFFKSIEMEGYAYGVEDGAEITFEEGLARAYAAWVIFMTLMAETYSFPPPPSTSSDISPLLSGHLEQIEILSHYERESFRSSLSDVQACSWRILRDWWEGTYQSCTLSQSARRFIEAAGQLNIEHLNHNASLYHENLFCLFDAEFNPAGYKTGTSRGHEGNRRLAFDHALAQKAAYVLYSRLSPAKNKEADILKIGMSFEPAYDVCPWLPSAGKGGKDHSQLPYFLWDGTRERTVKVKELLNEGFDIQYTCISHTWGRYQKSSPPVRVNGVDEWMVPENTVFEVRNLPEILSQAPILTRFVWFDLVCIPQDKSQELYLIEVSRQALIFQHASSCIAWLNTINSWQNTEAAARWLCLNYLHRGNEKGHYETEHLILRAGDEANVSIELVIDSDNLTPWLSSLWTLQEACLCPDIILCNKNWQAVSVLPRSTITLNQLLSLYSLNSEAYFKKTFSLTAWPQGPSQLFHVQRVLFGMENRASRVGIMARGQTRTCKERRAEAVMSVLGVTDWYEEYVGSHGSPPPDTDLVLGTYPLAFVREAAQKMSSLFYMAFKPMARLVPVDQVSGSMLPFGYIGDEQVTLETGALEQEVYQDIVDHPSVSQWEIQSDGSVEISEAGILRSCQRPNDNPVKVVLNIAAEDGVNESCATDLQTWLMLVSDGMVRVAISLCKVAHVHTGLILEGVQDIKSNRTVLRSIGNWDTVEDLDFPPTEAVNFTVR